MAEKEKKDNDQFDARQLGKIVDSITGLGKISKKEGKKILWHVLEQPTNNIVAKHFFEDEAIGTESIDGIIDFSEKNPFGEPTEGM